jgi:cytochrome oxidase Cu insertion factor (SCO1/SenC/PrrC family)
MKTRNMALNLMLLLAFLLAACGGSAPEAMDKPEEEMMEKPTEEAMTPHDTPAPDAMAEPTEEARVELPAWFGASFKDLRSGEAFTVNDFRGKVILVETMAVWCSTCYQQQIQIKALHESLGMREDFVSISLDVDPNEDESILSEYTQQNSGFDWRYAIASPDTIREIGNTYGNQFLNPPSAPILVIDRQGVAHPLPFGLKSAEEMRKMIQPYLDESM